GGFLCRFLSRGQNKLQKFATVSGLLRTVMPNFARLQTYIIQQGIVLDRYNNRPVDYRVHLHRNGNNEWAVAAIAAKVAGDGSVTTHVRTGGMVVPA
ncbi:MAG: YheC/YheD family protein, partial [Bacilli bacterium]